MRKNKRKRLAWGSVAVSLLFLLVAAAGCTNSGTGSRKDRLVLKQNNETLSLENNAVKVVFNAADGGIREYRNKQSDLYFVKNVTDATPIRLAVKTAEGSTANERNILPQTFAATAQQNDDRIGFVFSWEFSNGATAVGTVRLESGSDEAVFRISLMNNALQNATYSVEYPIFEEIDTLQSYETDRLVSPFAMGYLFHDPVRAFNSNTESVKGINKENGYYPSGMFQSMQFFGFYSEGRGGFHVETRDGSENIKSFTFTATDGKLRASLWHYLPDIADGDWRFNYDIACANLTQGTWEESADRYKKWATQQTWCTEKGKNKDRTDLNKELYEDTVLCNFVEPSRDFQTGCTEIYETIRTSVKAKTLVIPYYWTITPTPRHDDETALLNFMTRNSKASFFDSVRSFGDLISYFEYFNCALSTDIPAGFEQNAVVTQKGDPLSAVFGSTSFIYQCPSDEWNDMTYTKERILSEKLGADGYYNDIGIGATIRSLCYNTNHAHGTKVSVLEEHLEQLKTVSDLSRTYNGFTGQEMLSEVMIPYVDIYQCRANAGEMGGMENDIIMDYVKSGAAEKIHLFEYIYKEYCGIRLDGFTLPLESVGTPYYYVTAFTALNGGIPEYNWEWCGDTTYPKASAYDTGMIGFISELGKARTDYGKNFLVYGEMTKSPDVGAGKTRYAYSTPINNGDGSWSDFDQQGNKTGNMLCDNVVVSAFRANGEVAIFLCNITDAPFDVSFTINAKDDYGIEKGTVNVRQNGGAQKAADIRSGKANVELTLPSRKVVMLTVANS